MKAGFWVCVIPCGIFFILGLLFAALKEKGAMLVSGFNTMAKQERAKYDRARISRDMRNQCFLWSGIMLAGAVLSWLLTPYMAIPAWVVWLILFIREVRLDAAAAFEKYRK